MNAANAYDFAPRWNAQELADAVPLRLHQLIDFARDDRRSANADTAAPKRSARLRFVSAIALPMFSVR
ncbi:hypothetical protein J5226_00755 [Lysobacter sp. K5869]|uniref:hypothetical protein n=1 Tax=Lysobacter sp. K5869 TaxID=2820808 RepID=UPI001C05F9D4|nr:hypothetical protein [Lysobacter sp. K5869]QWP76972.1 hypothetical protein J5226_00755 [Lysobacter sp. K5869]